MSMIDVYSFVTIITIMMSGLIGLTWWYWSGRRPVKHSHL